LGAGTLNRIFAGCQSDALLTTSAGERPGAADKVQLFSLTMTESIDTWQQVARLVGQQGPQKACAFCLASKKLENQGSTLSLLTTEIKLPPEKRSEWQGISKQLDKRPSAMLSKTTLPW